MCTSKKFSQYEAKRKGIEGSVGSSGGKQKESQKCPFGPLAPEGDRTLQLEQSLLQQ
jgi:hypothetical protein